LAFQLETGTGRRLAQVVVLDASALIALVSSSEPHHDWALEMFLETSSFDLQMTCLTQAEVMVHPHRANKIEKFMKLIDGLNLEITPIEAADASQLASLRATTNLKMPDAVILSQAMKVSGSIATTDQALAKVARSKGVGVFHPSN
jgi:predicted nucleic acid-binding protein